MSRDYYTLVANEGSHIKGSPWGVAFGDYDLATVEAERDDYIADGWEPRNLKIITTPARQAAIDAAVAKLNEGN